MIVTIIDVDYEYWVYSDDSRVAIYPAEDIGNDIFDVIADLQEIIDECGPITRFRLVYIEGDTLQQYVEELDETGGTIEFDNLQDLLALNLHDEV